MRRELLHIAIASLYFFSAMLTTWHVHEAEAFEPDSVQDHHAHASECGTCETLAAASSANVAPPNQPFTFPIPTIVLNSSQTERGTFFYTRRYRLAPKNSPPAV